MPDEQDSYESATSKFYGFLASSPLHTLAMASGVIVAGLTRAGKSSAIMIQRGAVFKLNGRMFEPVGYRNGDPLVSSSSTSKTINVGVYDAGKRKFFDTAGLNENRGEDYECWTQFSLYTARCLMGDLHATIVVMNFHSMFDNTGDAAKIRILAQTVGEAVGGESSINSCFYDNMCYLMSNVRENDTDLEIIPCVFKLYTEELIQLRNVLCNLAKRLNKAAVAKGFLLLKAEDRLFGERLEGGYFNHPQMVKETKTAQKHFSRMSDAHKSVDFEKLNSLPDDDPDKKLWMSTTCSVRLLQALLKAGAEKVVLSYPNGESRCRKQRHAVERMVNKCNTICQKDLKTFAAGRGPGGSLRVYGVLAHVARQMTELIDDVRTTAETLAKLAKERQNIIKAIQSDWSCYRDSRVLELLDEIKSAKAQLVEKVNKIEELKESKKLVAPPESIYFIKQDIDTWSKWFGFSRVTHRISHKGPFEDYVVDEDSNHLNDPEVLKNGNGELELEFRGHLWAGLTVCVRVRRYEKDTAYAKATIKNWGDDVEKKKKRIEEFQEKVHILKSIRTMEGLVEVLVNSELASQKEAYYNASSKFYHKQVPTTIFHGEDNDEIHVTYFEVCRGLENLLAAMLRQDAMPVLLMQMPNLVKSFGMFLTELRSDEG